MRELFSGPLNYYADNNLFGDPYENNFIYYYLCLFTNGVILLFAAESRNILEVSPSV